MFKTYAPLFAPEDEGAGGPAPADPPANPAADPPGDPAPSDKPAEPAPAEKDDKTALDPGDKKGEEAEGAPEQYEDFSLPEGVEIDAKAVEAFQGVARELNLSQQQAQALVDFQANMMKEVSEASEKEWATTVENWLVQAKDDKEIGGEKFDANIEVAKRAISKFGSPALVEALNDFGIGNHPEFIRFALNVGKTISESDIVPGKAGQGTLSIAERLYPSMAKR